MNELHKKHQLRRHQGHWGHVIIRLTDEHGQGLLSSELMSCWFTKIPVCSTFDLICKIPRAVLHDVAKHSARITLLNKLWTMSDVVKYKNPLWSFLKLTALVFHHVWYSPLDLIFNINYLIIRIRLFCQFQTQNSLK